MLITLEDAGMTTAFLASDYANLITEMSQQIVDPGVTLPMIEEALLAALRS